MGLLVLVAGILAVTFAMGGRKDAVALAPMAAASEKSLGTPTPTIAVSDAPGTYTVRPSDTLYGIATRLGVSEEQLRFWNLEKYPSLRSMPREISVGWVLNTEGPPLPTPTPGPTARPTTAVPDGLVALPLLTANVRDAAEVYHAISGRNPSQIEASASSTAPSVCHETSSTAWACAGPRVWDIQPSYIQNPSTGACTLLGFGLFRSPQYTAYLPQWSTPRRVPPELLAWWRTVLEHIRWHEEQHILIFESYVAKLKTLGAGQSCTSGQALIDTWSRQIQAAQDAFDVKDRSWKLPSYTGPWNW